MGIILKLLTRLAVTVTVMKEDTDICSLFINNNNFNSSACLLLNEVGKRISINTGESRETGFLFQRGSVLVQRFSQCYSVT